MTGNIDRQPPGQREFGAQMRNRSRGSYDQLLLDVARRGCSEAFSTLFTHFTPRVEIYLRRLGASPAQAEDLAQDVMLTVWQRAVQFDVGRAPVGAWILAIARNRLIDLQRRNGRARAALDQATVVDITDSKAEEAVYLSQIEHLRKAMAALPDEQIELLRAVYYGDKSQSTLAHERKLALGTIKSRQRLALAKLRRLLIELQ